MISISIKKLWILLIINQIAADHCVQKSPCECDYGNGFGYNLTALDASQSLEAKDYNNSLQYLFHPCRDTTIVPNHANASNDCTLYSVCVYNATANNFTFIANTKNAVLKVNTDSSLYLVYKNEKRNTTTTISLACTNIEKNHLFVLDGGELFPNEVNLILYSKEACLKQLYIVSTLSTGAVLNITFLIMVFAYLTIGISVDYFLMGARGIEVIPHLAFWKDFPFLVRDGVKFVQNGCRIQPSDLSENRDIYTSI